MLKKERYKLKETVKGSTQKRDKLEQEQYSIEPEVDQASCKVENPFYKLLINGKSPYDKFLRDCQGSVPKFNNQKEELNALILLIAQGLDYPLDRVDELSGREDKYREFEFKIGRTRVYYFSHPDIGNIIINGHCNKRTEKTDQGKYIERFRTLKKEYLNQINKIKK